MPAGIYKREFPVPPLRFTVDPVPGDTRRILDDRDPCRIYN